MCKNNTPGSTPISDLAAGQVRYIFAAYHLPGNVAVLLSCLRESRLVAIVNSLSHLLSLAHIYGPEQL